jgi:DNA-binding GntR family transcriptional regulator
VENDATDSDSVSEKAYRQIRSDIVFGRLAPGQKLRLEAMKDAYEAGVSTLREILARLASERFVVAEASRGFEVAPISETDLREVARMRELLECHALKESFLAGDIEWEGRVVAAHHKLATLEKRIATGDRAQTETWKGYDWAFHHALISNCGSKVLLDLHASIYDKYLRYQLIAAIFRGEIAGSEHRRLLECALSRDWEAAQKTLVKHVDDCVTNMIHNGLRPTNSGSHLPLMAPTGSRSAHDRPRLVARKKKRTRSAAFDGAR